MTETMILFLAALAVIALMAVLIYVAGCGRTASALALSEIRRSLDQLLASNRSIERALVEQRRVLNDAHKNIHTAVTKGVQKPAA